MGVIRDGLLTVEPLVTSQEYSVYSLISHRYVLTEWWSVKEVWHEMYVELERLDSDSSMEDSWRLMEFCLF